MQTGIPLNNLFVKMLNQTEGELDSFEQSNGSLAWRSLPTQKTEQQK